MTWAPIPDAAKAVLADQHPDPFVQAAIWRLWSEAPGLLDADLAQALHAATTTP